MPLLVCQLDNNFLGLTLFENGQMAFARYVPISPEDYESEDYLIEALNENIFRMEQFNKARGGPGLDNVILYGQIDDYIKLVDALDGLDIKASILGVPAQITGYENFEFTVFANAIGALYKRNKQTERINLLEVDSSTGKSSAGLNSLLITAGVVVCASAIAIAAISLFINMRESNIQDDIAAAEKSIAECDDIINENLQYHVFLDVAANYKTKVENAKNNLSTLPVLKKQVFDQIDSVTGSNIEYEGFTYDETQGLVTITNVKLTKQLDAPSFVKSNKES